MKKIILIISIFTSLSAISQNIIVDNQLNAHMHVDVYDCGSGTPLSIVSPANSKMTHSYSGYKFEYADGCVDDCGGCGCIPFGNLIGNQMPPNCNAGTYPAITFFTTASGNLVTVTWQDDINGNITITLN